MDLAQVTKALDDIVRAKYQAALTEHMQITKDCLSDCSIQNLHRLRRSSDDIQMLMNWDVLDCKLPRDAIVRLLSNKCQ